MTNKTKFILCVIAVIFVLIATAIGLKISADKKEEMREKGKIAIEIEQNTEDEQEGELTVTSDGEPGEYTFLSSFTNTEILSAKYIPYGALQSLRYDTDSWLKENKIDQPIVFTITEDGSYNNRNHPVLNCTTEPNIGNVCISWNTITRDYEFEKK